MTRLLVAVSLCALVLSIYAFNSAFDPDPRLVGLAARATLYAVPTPTVRVMEVTRVVEVTRIVEVTRLVEVSATPQLTPTTTATPTPLPTADSEEALVAPEQDEQEVSAASARPTAASALAPGCPTSSSNQYTTIPVLGEHPTYPDTENGELNLALRGYVPVDSDLTLVAINGPTDGDAPQFSGLFADRRVPDFVGASRVRQWNWACGEHGCRSETLSAAQVSLIAMATSQGEAISIPSRRAEIYGGGFKALVLFADLNRITLTYTREDTIARGYAIHIEQICVDPNLVSLYRANQQAGRWELPAIRNGETVGTAADSSIAVAVRDSGRFLDPRSRKDWWQGN